MLISSIFLAQQFSTLKPLSHISLSSHTLLDRQSLKYFVLFWDKNKKKQANMTYTWWAGGHHEFKT